MESPYAYQLPSTPREFVVLSMRPIPSGDRATATTLAQRVARPWPEISQVRRLLQVGFTAAPGVCAQGPFNFPKVSAGLQVRSPSASQFNPAAH
jgi:hypothetical protein